MDWTFWVGGAVIVAALIVTQVFLHESRWSRRPRAEEPHDPAAREGSDEPDDAERGEGDRGPNSGGFRPPGGD